MRLARFYLLGVRLLTESSTFPCSFATVRFAKHTVVFLFSASPLHPSPKIGREAGGEGKEMNYGNYHCTFNLF